MRLAHCIVVFPGGAGTAEELLYVLSIMMHERNADQKLGLILAASEESKDYFAAVDALTSLPALRSLSVTLDLEEQVDYILERLPHLEMLNGLPVERDDPPPKEEEQ